MKKLLLTSLALGLMGCGHRPVASQRTVEFPFATELLARIQASSPISRVPAGLQWMEREEKSLRRTYFAALYHQYQSLGTYLQMAAGPEFCPQFHHDKLQVDAQGMAAPNIFRLESAALEGAEYFPELAFSENFSLKDYHQTLKSEITTLCEEGISDNFYKFDNLVTHYAAKSSFHLNTKSMTAVLKIPVFANLYLLKMLEAHPAEVVFMHPEEKRVIELTRTQWFTQYLTEATKVRNDLIRTKMVRR
jgi:hypothetical protein